MRKKIDNEDELFKEINEMCLACIKECKQPKGTKIYKCPYQPNSEKSQ